MQKEIKYNGYSATPSDYLSPDGDLAYSLNIIPEYGALQPLHAPQVIAENLPGVILAVHRIGDREHYIMLASGSHLCWAQAEKVNTGTTSEVDIVALQVFDAGVLSVTPIGNTLAVLDSNGVIHYFLWKTNAYINLGSQLPELEASATLNTRVFNRDNLKTYFEEQGLDFTPDYEDGSSSSSIKNDSLLLTEEDTEEGGKKVEDTYKGGWLRMDKMDGFFNNDKLFRSFDDGHYKDARENIYNRVFAVLNNCKTVLNSNGLFSEPFFIRFAYRLYDGTHCRHTTPLLLCPNSWGQPIVALNITSNGKTFFSPHIIASDLLANIHLASNLDDWSDIITHIDVFVTPPLISYTDSPDALVGISKLPFFSKEGEQWVIQDDNQPRIMSGNGWEYFTDLATESTTTIQFPGNRLINLRSFTDKYKGQGTNNQLLLLVKLDDDLTFTDENGDEITFNNISEGGFVAIPIPQEGLKIQASKDFEGTFRLNGFRTPDFSKHHYIELRRTDGKDINEVVTGYNSFFKLAEIDAAQMVNGNGFFGNLPINRTVLSAITTQPTLPDTGQQNSPNIASHVFSYNNRLNIIVKGEELPTCAGIRTQNFNLNSRRTLLRAYVRVVENSQESYYELPDGRIDGTYPYITYFAYPKAAAVELLLYSYIAASLVLVEKIPLTRHPFLNLAYVFNNFNEIKGSITKLLRVVPTHPQTPILYGNKIKTSDVNNPFIFNEENTTELPVGNVLALSTAAKALSQGQFGQFPLYAFTDEGIWALEVTGTGTYAGRQVITRDICDNPASITQIDNAVIFTSDRGIMLLAGSDTTCISEILNGPVFDISQLGHLEKPIQMIPWDDYRKNIQLLYCYSTQKIIVFNTDKEYFYVYSLKSKQWAIQEGKIDFTVSNFPQAYAISGDTLVDYAVEGDALSGAFVTRPLKLDAPDVHKTITAIIQRGQFKKGHVSTLLYGSRDLEKWYPVWGSKDHYLRGMRGTPYKYFRIASAVNLADGENLYGASVQYETKLDNKLR